MTSGMEKFFREVRILTRLTLSLFSHSLPNSQRDTPTFSKIGTGMVRSLSTKQMKNCMKELSFLVEQMTLILSL